MCHRPPTAAQPSRRYRGTASSRTSAQSPVIPCSCAQRPAASTSWLPTPWPRRRGSTASARNRPCGAGSPMRSGRGHGSEQMVTAPTICRARHAASVRQSGPGSRSVGSGPSGRRIRTCRDRARPASSLSGGTSRTSAMSVTARTPGPGVVGETRDPAQAPFSSGSRHSRSNGSRQAAGATSWWMALGPHEPGAYGRTGGMSSRTGLEIFHSRSMPSAVVNRV